MKRFFVILIFILTFISGSCVFSLENLDLSVDSEIRKKYGVDDISLPPLPKVEDNKGFREVEIESEIPVKELANKNNSIVIKKGTKLKLKLMNDVSDGTRVGSIVSFSLMYPVSVKFFTIPKGTIFYGQVLKSHTPQISGNGGLIIIHLKSVKLNSKKYYLSGRVLKANSKHIFLNNIKGKRKYIVSLPKSITWGRNCKNKMYKLTKKYSKKKSTWILCPFTFVFGMVAYGSNIILAPMITLKYKGDRIKINKESEFVFKLTQDLYIY